MKRIHQITALAITALLGVGIVATPVTAQASEEGRRNTALGLGAAAAALILTQRNPVPGVVVGAGAAYAATQLRDCDRHYDRDRDRHDDHDRRWDRDGRRDRH